MRSFLAIVVVCLVAVVAAAWWFQWWGVTVNPDKAKHDIAAIEGGITDGVNKLKGRGTDKETVLSQGRPVDGTIHAIDSSKHSFTVMSKKEEVTVQTDATTKFRVGDHDGTLADLQVGDRAVMTYEAGAEENMASTVTVAKGS